MNIPKTSPCLFFIAVFSLFSCNTEFKSDDYTAYFGGEVINPSAPYVVLVNDSGFSDTLRLDKNNRFFAKLDSLSPGLYTFKHEPEYQYVYFDKNDSLMVTINSHDFDNSIVFSGRGDMKNNVLMELYLANEKDRDNLFTMFEYPLGKFNQAIDAAHQKNKKYYEAKKQEIRWSDEFDVVARAAVDFPYYSKKEVYPIVHKIRTGNNVFDELPKDYYAFRKTIDYNSQQLSDFSPFVKYVTFMLGNVAAAEQDNNLTGPDLALKTNITKMRVADTLIDNEKTKNAILNHIAFTYLLEDQNVSNNQKFLECYQKCSTDKSQKNEITKIGNAIKLLRENHPLPEVELLRQDGKTVSSTELVKGKKTVIFFWTTKAATHILEAHKKVIELKKGHPDYQFVGVNLDEDFDKWKTTLANYKFDGVVEVRYADFEDLRSKWALTKIHRTMVIHADGTLKNAFTGLFDSEFEKNLE